MSTETITYRVDGMTCDHCKAAVNDEVAKLAGVESVAVDLETRLVRVSGDGVDHDAVVAAVERCGLWRGARVVRPVARLTAFAALLGLVFAGAVCVRMHEEVAA